MKTTLLQTCTSVRDSLGATKFSIENAITEVASGDLPSASVFVFQLGQLTDPKSDTFLRIGSIQDITQYPVSRTAAIQTGSTTYLATGFTVLYDDVATATAAKQLIQSRLDQLIADWRQYNAAFVSPTNIEFPLNDAGLVAAKKSAYVAARSAKAAADAALLALTADLTVKQAAAAAAATDQAHKLSDSTECASINLTVTGLKSAETVFRAAAETFLAGVIAATTLEAAQALTAAFSAALTLEAANLRDPLQTLSTSLTTSCSNKAGAASQAAGVATAANTAISTAQRSALLAQQTALTAQTTLETALAETLEVCPSFDPASV